MCAVKVGDWSGPENRKSRRVPLGVAIQCRLGFVVYEGRAENISSSGLLVRSEQQSSEDSLLLLNFALPGNLAHIQAEARVAHVVPGVFMGLEFSRISEADRAAIGQYVNSVPEPAAKS